MLPRARLVSLAAHAKRRGGIDLMLRYNPMVRRQVQNAIRAFEQADESGRRDLTEAMTLRVLEAARRTRYGQGRSLRYVDWPMLAKTQLRDAPEDFTSGGMLCIPAATGGTSGQPIRLWRSPTCVAAEQVFLDHMVRCLGPSWATARVAVLRGDSVKHTFDWSPPFGLVTHGGRRLVLSSPHLTSATLPWFLERLEAFRPDILLLWPTMATNLMLLLMRHGRGRRLCVPIVIASSERLEPEIRAAMQREWSAVVLDHYGQAERVCLALSRRDREFWFNPAYGQVELVATDDDEICDGQRHVAIIATGFWNPAMPLVRYNTGDLAIVPADASAADLRAIALGLKPFAGIAGRSDEFLLGPGGIRIAGLNQLPREVANLLQLQIVQESMDKVVLRALVRPSFRSIDHAQLVANARAKIPPAISFRTELVDHLQAEPNGKTPFIMRAAHLPSG